jgi:hypothetical protein
MFLRREILPAQKPLPVSALGEVGGAQEKADAAGTADDHETTGDILQGTGCSWY